MAIDYWHPEPGTELDEAALTEQLTAEGYHVSRYVYPPGMTFADHTHDVAKVEVILAGRFRLGMAGESLVLEAGQAIHVPKGAVHNAEVVGNEPVVSLDAVRP
ncbi:MAG TPA: cupin domain-containing protein [Gammaproteobacteria bacterium]|nr:cupin domain-containing protein [Gammaproteobacteria bacterium]